MAPSSPLTPEQRERLYNAFHEVDDPTAGDSPHAMRETLGFYCEGFITYSGLLALLPVLTAIVEEQTRAASQT